MNILYDIKIVFAQMSDWRVAYMYVTSGFLGKYYATDYATYVVFSIVKYCSIWHNYHENWTDQGRLFQ